MDISVERGELKLWIGCALVFVFIELHLASLQEDWVSYLDKITDLTPCIILIRN